jgi:hypothetical protein
MIGSFSGTSKLLRLSGLVARSNQGVIAMGYQPVVQSTKFGLVINPRYRTPSFFCRLEDEVVYWNTRRLSGYT